MSYINNNSLANYMSYIPLKNLSSAYAKVKENIARQIGDIFVSILSSSSEKFRNWSGAEHFSHENFKKLIPSFRELRRDRDWKRDYDSFVREAVQDSYSLQTSHKFQAWLEKNSTYLIGRSFHENGIENSAPLPPFFIDEVESAFLAAIEAAKNEYLKQLEQLPFEQNVLENVVHPILSEYFLQFSLRFLGIVDGRAKETKFDGACSAESILFVKHFLNCPDFSFEIFEEIMEKKEQEIFCYQLFENFKSTLIKEMKKLSHSINEDIFVKLREHLKIDPHTFKNAVNVREMITAATASCFTFILETPSKTFREFITNDVRLNFYNKGKLAESEIKKRVFKAQENKFQKLCHLISVKYKENGFHHAFVMGIDYDNKKYILYEPNGIGAFSFPSSQELHEAVEELCSIFYDVQSVEKYGLERNLK